MLERELSEEEEKEIYGKYGLECPIGTVDYLIREQAEDFGVDPSHEIMQNARKKIEEFNPDGGIDAGLARFIARSHAQVARYGNKA